MSPMNKSGQRYWRSLEQLTARPAAPATGVDEFPAGASEPPQEFSRREMLGLIGASLSLAGLSACRRPVEHIVPYVTAPEGIVPGIPQRYATNMPFGLHSYGLVVESHEGRPTKIEGNTLHPSTGGSSSSWIQASILGLFDPDRSRAVHTGGDRSDWGSFDTAWADLAANHDADGGAGLAVLAEPHASPTLSRMLRALNARFPNMRSATWEPVGDENLYIGIQQATGRWLQPVLHFDQADVVVALDSDFLATDAESVRHARGFAARRRIESPQDEPNRLYVAESTPTPTGGTADWRVRARGSEIGVLTVALIAELEARGLPSPGGSGWLPSGAAPGLNERQSAWVAAAADDLLAHRGRGLLVAGPRQPASVHAAVASINAALGNDTAVTYHEIVDTTLPRAQELAELTDAIRAEQVTTLLMIGGNPVYDAPADLGFGELLGDGLTSIHLGREPNETSAQARWSLPMSHYLEAWGDCRAVGGWLGVTQPLIAPLFDTRSTIEVVAMMAGLEQTGGYELVQETWAGLGGGQADWNRVLHDGILADSEAEPVVPTFVPDAAYALAASAMSVPQDGLEIDYRLSPAVHDGRLANVSWLQELPDAATKLTWDNVAVISPATARELSVDTEDVVTLSQQDRQLEIPALVLPGQADNCVTVHLGYGRTVAGTVGTGVGANAYALRTSDAPSFAGNLGLTKTGRRHLLACTQEHWAIDKVGATERDRRVPELYRQASLEQYRRNPEFVKEHEIEGLALKNLWPGHSYDEGYQWGMTIDLNSCVGCNACVIACQAENNIPVVGKDQVSRGREMHWIRIDRYFAGDPDDPDELLFQPVACMHCENAPCEQVCPVAATVHDSEGLNVMVYNRCIGTRYCSNNCPYKVRRFNYYNFTKGMPPLLEMTQNPDVTVRSRGVMEKCTFCVQRLSGAKIDAKLAGTTVQDGDVQTACQQACPAGAIQFGNIRDEGSRVVQAKAQDRNYVMLREMNNRPRTSYLARIRNSGAGHDGGGDA